MEFSTIKEFYEWACAHNYENYDFGYCWEIGPFVHFLSNEFVINEKEEKIFFNC